jgi:hypothetical protein
VCHIGSDKTECFNESWLISPSKSKEEVHMQKILLLELPASNSERLKLLADSKRTV